MDSEEEISLHKVKLYAGAVLMAAGATVLAGCGAAVPTHIGAPASPPASSTPSGSGAGNSSASATATAVTPPASTETVPVTSSLRPVAYTASQRQEILSQAAQAGFSRVYAPTRDVQGTQFKAASHFVTTPQPSSPVLEVSYNNIGFQVAPSLGAFGTGGDRLGQGTVTLHVPGVSHTIPGHWEKVQGHVGPPTRQIEFRLGGAFYAVGSTTLSLHQLVSIIDSMKPLALSIAPLRPVVYTASQRQDISAQAAQAGFPRVYVPTRDIPGTQFQSASHFVTTPQPSWPVLEVSYNNIGFQIAPSLGAFGTGGDRLGQGTVTLHVPGVSHPIPGHWEEVQGHVGPPSRGIEFRLGSKFYALDSTTLSLHQLVLIIDSMKPLTS